MFYNCLALVTSFLVGGVLGAVVDRPNEGPNSVYRSSDPWRPPPPDPAAITMLIDPSGVPNLPIGQPENLSSDIPGPSLTPDEFKLVILIDQAYNSNDHNKSDPLELAGAFEGDIILANREELLQMTQPMDESMKLRNAVMKSNRIWPNAVIPYVISAAYTKQERGIIAVAMGKFHRESCIKYVPRTNHKDYIHIYKGDGCSSSVGRVGGHQAVSLGPGCLYVGIVMHELMHASGFWHEQSRFDRDQYVRINWSNIQSGMDYNFQKYDWNTIQHLNTKYDLGSVMHYGPYSFAKDRSKKTIQALNSAEIGQRRGFSKLDIQKLRILYKCSTSGGTAPVTTPHPLIIPPIGECKDSNTYCYSWADMGECKRNPAWMEVNCKKSCRKCGMKCQDLNTYCTYWGEQGECTANAGYMHVFCKKACAMCNSL